MKINIYIKNFLYISILFNKFTIFSMNASNDKNGLPRIRIPGEKKETPNPSFKPTLNHTGSPTCFTITSPFIHYNNSNTLGVHNRYKNNEYIGAQACCMAAILGICVKCCCCTKRNN